MAGHGPGGRRKSARCGRSAAESLPIMEQTSPSSSLVRTRPFQGRDRGSNPLGDTGSTADTPAKRGYSGFWGDLLGRAGWWRVEGEACWFGGVGAEKHRSKSVKIAPVGIRDDDRELKPDAAIARSRGVGPRTPPSYGCSSSGPCAGAVRLFERVAGYARFGAWNGRSTEAGHHEDPGEEHAGSYCRGGDVGGAGGNRVGGGAACGDAGEPCAGGAGASGDQSTEGTGEYAGADAA